MKVMQVLYALDQHAISEMDLARKNLSKSIRDAYDLLMFDLALLIRVAHHVEKQGQLRSSKLLPNEEDIKFSTRFANNRILSELAEDKNIRSILNREADDDVAIMVKSIFTDLEARKIYKSYAEGNPEEFTEEKEIVQYLFNKIIIKNKIYRQYLEDNYPECLNDTGKIYQKINEIITGYDSNLKTPPVEPETIKNEEQFASTLLDKTVENDDHFSGLIEPKLDNWDIDRIALIDMILMKMALSELLYFEQIPIKVSINEYIDISKIYSTPKSKDFVNGVLDKIKNELKASGKIKKVGRGLVE